MEVVRTTANLRSQIKKARLAGLSVGFVPTMGFLHEGHLSLLRQARQENDLVVLSIFVNPLQFGRGEDYEDYPRDLKNDADLAAGAGCDLIFVPSVNDMYPPGHATFVEVERLTEGLCGASRPAHFRGVTTVVAKLFNIVTPNRVYFGQKDAQQALVIKRMARDLDMDLQVLIMPTIREADGLSMSSRNAYLNSTERAIAPVLYRSLQQAAVQIAEGERDAGIIKDSIKEMLETAPFAKLDYVSLVDCEELREIKEIKGRILIALAVHFGRARLIDNIIVEV